MSEIYDCIIIGGGVAGLSASIFLTRAKFSTLLIEKEHFGGQINITDHVVNYPGIMETTGKDLTSIMKKQALRFGVKTMQDEVIQVHLTPTIKEIKTKSQTYKSLSVILASGAHPRILDFPGEKEFQGRGIAYCATCDGEFFQDCDIFVVGGGYAACQEAHFLTRYARHITMIVREEDFTCASQVADLVRNNEKISILFQHVVEKVEGIDYVNRIYIQNIQDKQIKMFEAKRNERLGVFIFVGYEPETNLFKNQIELDSNGYILVDKNQKTNIDGVYGAGDVCQKELRQVVTAVSDGAIAATSLEKVLSNMHHQKHIKTKGIETNDNEYKEQLETIVEKFKKKVHMVLQDNGTEQVKEMKECVENLCSFTGLLSYETKHDDEAGILLFDENNNNRFDFYLVPGGHEINSFIYALFALSTMDKLHEFQERKTIKVFVSLSCTKCPELVMNLIRVLQEFKEYKLKIYDLRYYPYYQNQYNIMSVPCMLIDDEVYFGKKTEDELVQLLKKHK